jgi:N-acetylmuramoyl-L-alanine amidase
MRLIALVIGLALALSGAQAQTKAGSLKGWVVVVDPGHGGSDPGSHGIHRGKSIIEAQYVYDVSLRVARMIRERQGLTFLTIKNNCGERNNQPQDILPDDRTARFSTDGTLVQAGTTGLYKRVEFGNKISRNYPTYRKAWISIHFDVVGSRSDVKGVRLISPDNSSRFIRAFEQSFGAAKRLRDVDAVVENGDKGHGIRHLFVLGSTNRIGNKVLVELGNFLNDDDLWRIRDPKVRESYAQEIVKALELY